MKQQLNFELHDFCPRLLASERNTYRGKNEKNRGCLYICMDGRMSFCTLTLAFLC